MYILCFSIQRDGDQISLSSAQLPVQLPVGSVQVVLKNVSAVITPLPSLIVSYKVLLPCSPLFSVYKLLMFTLGSITDIYARDNQ